MQTRRDQLQAYRFQNRRALAALVTGEPNVLEPPMRRLTVTTLSGIMVAILIGVVFGLLALFRPSAGTSWKKDGAVIIDDQTGSSYVYLHGVLHPAVNYTSAVLAVSGSQAVSAVHVESSDLSGARYGAEIGIATLPQSLPSASELVSWPMSLCSRAQPTSGGAVDARTILRLGGGTRGSALGSALPGGAAVLVQPVGATGYDLIQDGERRAMSTAVAQQLHLDTADAVRVGTAFLDGVPAAAPFTAPVLAGAGGPSQVRVGGATPTIGQLVEIGSTPYLVLGNSAAQLSPVQAAVVAAAGGKAPLSLPSSTVLPPLTSLTTVSAGFAALPTSVPTPDADAATNGGVCLTWAHRGSTAALSVPPSALGGAFPGGAIGESAASQAGYADSVLVPATHALLVEPADGATSPQVIGDQGVRYPVASAAVLTAFGYSGSDVTRMPPQLLGLIHQGAALDPSAALRTVGR